MKIAITSQGPDRTSELDPRFGRAHYILIADLDSSALEVLDNHQNLQAAQGAGIQTARTVAQAGVGAVITGHVGPKAMAVLQAAELKVFQTAGGTVAQALEAYRAGTLTEISQADVQGHW
jgi:predicted Fe-Mo cluster-binding NifX family protein